MSRLRVLSLRDNKMTSLSESTFNSIKPTISRLDVDGKFYIYLIYFTEVILFVYLSLIIIFSIINNNMTLVFESII
jgi:hypothetical protein